MDYRPQFKLHPDRKRLIATEDVPQRAMGKKYPNCNKNRIKNIAPPQAKGERHPNRKKNDENALPQTKGKRRRNHRKKSIEKAPPQTKRNLSPNRRKKNENIQPPQALPRRNEESVVPTTPDMLVKKEKETEELIKQEVVEGEVRQPTVITQDKREKENPAPILLPQRPRLRFKTPTLDFEAVPLFSPHKGGKRRRVDSRGSIGMF